MAHDVFISYSSKDKPIADGICARMEADGLRCWIAPRDIGPGEDWPTAIANGIASSRVMVLVFSQNSNMSEEVSRELYLAANSKVVIIPFVIENVKPEAGKAYYLGRTHWLDATNPPTNAQIGQLIETVRSLMKVAAQPAASGAGLGRGRKWAVPVVLVLLAALVIGMISFFPQIVASFPVGLSWLAGIDPSEYLLREDFDDPENEGSLPSNWELVADWCSNIKVTQENGSLVFDAPAGIRPQCNMAPNSQFMLSQVKAVEFALGVSPDMTADQPGMAFIFEGHGDADTMLYLICGVSGQQSGCDVGKDQQNVYRTKRFVAEPGTSYVFRIEVLDPDLVSFRFLVDGDPLGEYTMLPADAEVYKNLRYRVSGGVVGPNEDTMAAQYLMDYLAVEQR
jgi:hypothetical protein